LTEIWASIDEFPTYLVSNFGRVKRADTGRILCPGGRTQRGYVQYHFFDRNGQRHPRYISRLVAEAFIGSVEGFEVDHLDDDNTNNHVSNLEIVTPKVNSQRVYDRGRRVPPSMKAVRIVETGEEFQSISDCARFLNRSLSSVSYALQNKTPTAGIHLEEVIS
jgi:HNH endonuclease/NUMOD4 motif